jgi:sn-glycerol 3-phosphate transport system substrate-binding protein
MKLRSFAPALAAAALATLAALPAQAQTEIQWWHSMTAVNNEWVNDLAKQFNASQKDYKIVPTYKGSYDESMTQAVAAFRSGNAPHILQVFEVGTATMMASKGVVMPVGQMMKDAGYKFDPTAYVPAVAELPFQQLDHGLLHQPRRLQGRRPGCRQAAHHLA